MFLDSDIEHNIKKLLPSIFRWEGKQSCSKSLCSNLETLFLAQLVKVISFGLSRNLNAEGERSPCLDSLTTPLSFDSLTTYRLNKLVLEC